LKESYRQTLSAGVPDVLYVLLEGSAALIAGRLAGRHHEYMNPGLLESQFRTLELPEYALRVRNDRAPGAVVDEILERLGG
jgi:gluconokinase